MRLSKHPNKLFADSNKRVQTKVDHHQGVVVAPIMVSRSIMVQAGNGVEYYCVFAPQCVLLALTSGHSCCTGAL